MDESIKSSDIGLEEIKKICSNELCAAYGRSGIGGRMENQDSYGAFFSGNHVMVTVCDGMGGMNGGQTASWIGRSEIQSSFLDVPPLKWSEELLYTAIDRANKGIYQRALNDPPLRGMGTTATILMLTPEAAYATHIGDSRIYQFRNGKKIFRTLDHSKVFEMVANGTMTEEQARQSCFSNIITRALGIRPEVAMTVEKLPYKKGDRFVLCCDGIWNCVPEPEMIEMMNSERNADLELKYLTERVNGIGIEKGGDHDNLTAIVVDMYTDSEYQYSVCHKLGKVLKGLGKRFKQCFKKSGTT